MLSEPLAGKRHVRVQSRRTQIDFSEVIRELSDELHPDAEKIVLVMDNLNTHTIASLYEAFEPAIARRLAEKLEIHYTPKHGDNVQYFAHIIIGPKRKALDLVEKKSENRTSI